MLICFTGNLCMIVVPACRNHHRIFKSHLIFVPARSHLWFSFVMIKWVNDKRHANFIETWHETSLHPPCVEIKSHKNLHLRLDNKSRLHNQTGPKLNSQPIQNQSTLKVEPNRTQPSGCLLTKPCTRKIRCAKNAVGKTWSHLLKPLNN